MDCAKKPDAMGLFYLGFLVLCSGFITGLTISYYEFVLGILWAMVSLMVGFILILLSIPGSRRR